MDGALSQKRKIHQEGIIISHHRFVIEQTAVLRVVFSGLALGRGLLNSRLYLVNMQKIKTACLLFALSIRLFANH